MRILQTPSSESLLEKRLLRTDSIGQKIVAQVETCRRAGKGIVRLLITHGVFLARTERFASKDEAFAYAERWLEAEIARQQIALSPILELAHA